MAENKKSEQWKIKNEGFNNQANPDLHYLNPAKRNSTLAGRHDMYDFTAILPGYEGITFRKEKCSGIDKWLYSFRDSCKASKEECDWLRRAKVYSLTDWDSIS